MYYVYKILFDTDHYYIGRRKCPNGVAPIDDIYSGSPTTNADYWSRYKFKKIILETYENKEDHIIGEHYYLGDKWIEDDLCLNASPANNVSNANMMWCNNGTDSKMFSECPKGWVPGRLSTAAKGKRYYTDGTDSKMFFEGEQPVGWVLGNTASRDPNKNPFIGSTAHNKNKLSYTNGSNIIYLNPNETPPKGFKRGGIGVSKGTFAGEKNPNAKPVVFNGRYFTCQKQAIEASGVGYGVFKRRVLKGVWSLEYVR